LSCVGITSFLAMTINYINLTFLNSYYKLAEFISPHSENFIIL
jgi:hypothetical protein